MVRQKKQTEKITVKELFEQLKGNSRLTRKDAAVQISVMAAKDIDQLKPYIPNLVAGLDNPEAHTRWECLRVLTKLISVDADACMKAVEGAQRALFEEANSRLTLAALRFLCRVGGSSEKKSKVVWPAIKDAIETFDGDLYYERMLAFVAEFAGGKISKDVKQELIELVQFDAEYDDGVLGLRAKAILQAIKNSSKKTLIKKAPAKKVTSKEVKPTKAKIVKKTVPKAAKKSTNSKLAKKSAAKTSQKATKKIAKKTIKKTTE